MRSPLCLLSLSLSLRSLCAPLCVAAGYTRQREQRKSSESERASACSPSSLSLPFRRAKSRGVSERRFRRRRAASPFFWSSIFFGELAFSSQNLLPLLRSTFSSLCSFSFPPKRTEAGAFLSSLSKRGAELNSWAASEHKALLSFFQFRFRRANCSSPPLSKKKTPATPKPSSIKMRATALLAVLAAVALSRGVEAQLSVSTKRKRRTRKEKPNRVVVVRRRLQLGLHHLLDREKTPSDLDLSRLFLFKKKKKKNSPLARSTPTHHPPPPLKPKKQAIQSAEETALNAYSAFKNLQLGELKKRR